MVFPSMDTAMMLMAPSLLPVMPSNQDIQNLKSLLQLCGLADVYQVFSIVVRITQQVKKLPHERMDDYFESVV